MTYQKRIKYYFLIVLSLLMMHSVAYAQDEEPALIQYFNKSIGLISKDSLDTLKLRSVIFDLIDQKIVAQNYTDIVRIIGKPVHTHLYKNGSRVLIYPCAYTPEGHYGSTLQFLRLDVNLEIIHRSAFVHFLETDEDFIYWYNNPPVESKEGGENCPPIFKP